MMKNNNRIFKIKELPFIELKYSTTFYECSQKHYHNMICILALKKGSAKYIVNEKELILKKNKLIVINPNEVHYSICDKKNEDYYVIYIDRNWYKTLQNQIFNSKDIIALPNIIEDLNINQEFFELFNILRDNNDVIEKELKVFNFFKNIFNKYIEEKIFLKIDETTKIAKEFKEYIEENISSKLTLSKIAKKLNVSPYHIIRICNQDFGLSANAYIVNKRVHRAKKLISDGVDISQAAVDVGFYDQSHLTNVFKKVFALTPKAYQNDIQISIKKGRDE
ncbi:AraC family transcriptional regulator [Poseidonibacter antarcticus]|uniref:AraC family transcriptional regulator n=1 Tax=Poseidonibacter antarcticus TaxID=2478538 RepID=UPI000EF52E3C|nr:AraC family transcriptional regulator [Poseidonibacter antarcticus]